MSPGNYRYPEVKTPLRRQVHGPSRIRRIGLSACTRLTHQQNRSPLQVSGNMFPSSFLTRNCNMLKPNALDREVIDVDDDDEVREVEMISDGSSMEFEIVENVAMEVNDVEEKGNEESLEVLNMENGSLMMEDDEYTEATKKSSVVSNRPLTDVRSYEAYKKVLNSAEKRSSKLKDRGFGDYLKERGRALLRSLRSLWHQDEELVDEAFRRLSQEDETVVKRAFSANIQDILVTHKNSNIDITGEKLRCLRPGQWLNDEVINLYLVLLKEREAREPKKFLKCHFFNTFFFTKLVNSGSGYNYGAVRRWTSMKRLGYHLKDCDKDRKFQYLDSFKGREPRILDALARYLVDEVRDKSEIDDIDVSWWKREFVQDLPEQKNGFDCGMFMLKYIDFYSRGLDLCFTQEQMPYFRVRTAKEILQLKAE
ncbi:hypothetical protein AALP_AA3G067700 [Arabis alpina]|uniref:Ubiquitin-like protease family profile domain-containing protein n=1 Tax=Arabis alpina TaxID=50452 RepID=A0A087H7I3_ARAAL|nr:hypothetical protein AALP_AA3G067700 [Arabis alpina]